MMICFSEMRLETDLLPIRTALRELRASIDTLPTSTEIRQIVCERLFGSPDVLEEFVATRTEIGTTRGTERMRVIYEPSDGFIRLLSALRAGQYEFLTSQDHGAVTPSWLFEVPSETRDETERR
jgi:hypothetical protein